MRRIGAVLVFAAAVMAVAVSGQAQIPRRLSYQGVLADSQGRPVSDGNYQMTFRMYHDSTGGVPDWEETRTVAVRDGRFSTNLGDVSGVINPCPPGPFDPNSNKCQTTFLAVVPPTGGEATPRMKLNSSLHSLASGRLVGKVSTGDGWVAMYPDTVDYLPRAVITSTDEDQSFVMVTDAGDTAVLINSSTGVEISGPIHSKSGGFKFPDGTWQWTAATSGDSYWTLPDQQVLQSVLYNGIARGAADNTWYGDHSYTITNLGAKCTTGVSGEEFLAQTICGGERNVATRSFSTVVGGEGNRAIEGYALIGGGQNNTSSGYWSAIVGGRGNSAAGSLDIVCGGQQNRAAGDVSFVGGGEFNLASGVGSTVAGGARDTATGSNATIAGGYHNVASGWYSTVAGGWNNRAVGDVSFAAGEQAQANHMGCFVWRDSDAGGALASTANNQWLARAIGGFYLYTSADNSTGVRMFGGANSWSSISDSATKENFSPVDGTALLAKLAAMPVREYNLKSQDPSIRHIGPVAQDMYAAFGYGETETAINMEDADGVALAAIQALYELNTSQKARIDQLERELAELRTALGELRKNR